MSVPSGNLCIANWLYEHVIICLDNNSASDCVEPSLNLREANGNSIRDDKSAHKIDE